VEELQSGVEEKRVLVPTDSVTLEGSLIVPPVAYGIVLFAHGSGSSRFSPRNRFVAQLLREGPLGTLLIDLLTEEEERVDRVTAELRFDIALLAERLVGATDWLAANPETRQLNIGCFGSSTGAAAALVAAAARPEVIGAVVSRGGRPDLAGEALELVAAPTLLLVGGNDLSVLELNQTAMAELGGRKRLQIIPGATHLFEEPGALEQVSRFARSWFECYLAQPSVRLPVEGPEG
jgi:dienelactone hydrolase